MWHETWLLSVCSRCRNEVTGTKCRYLAHMNAYDYDRQEWVDGEKGATLRRKQLQDELELLQGVRGADYARFTRVDRSQAIAAIKTQLNLH